jgi:hypothetical protein
VTSLGKGRGVENVEPERHRAIPWQLQTVFAVVLLMLFTLLVIVMLVARKDPDSQWKNLVYVFGSVEALVFTAVGWVFGREVHREQVKAAEGKEAESRERSEDLAHQASEAAREAAVERGKVGQLASAIRVAVESSADVAVTRGARDVGSAPAGAAAREIAPGLGALLRLANRISPEDG